MADEDRVFQNRARAESFGSVADQYDRFRPSYPSALIDDLLALEPRRVLDIGCGTGKAATLLVARGLDVLGVEIDPRMAAVARSHGVAVEVGAFETWDEAGRHFDLITSAQAWHWVDPAQAVPKAARLLNPGGTLALFWNRDAVAEPWSSALDGVYREFAPELMSSPGAAMPYTDDRPHAAPIERSGLFEPVEIRRYHSTRVDSAAEWVGMVRTHSDHVTLAPERREPLLTAVAAAIERLGRVIRSDVLTYTILARRRAAQ